MASVRGNRDALLKWLDEASNEEVGDLFKEYLLESAHGSWEGYKPSEVRAIYEMLADMNRYRELRAEFAKEVQG